MNNDTNDVINNVQCTKKLYVDRTFLTLTYR